MAFNAQPRISNGMLTLHPLAKAEFEGLYFAASMPETWAGNPKHDRWDSRGKNYWLCTLLSGT